MAAAGNNPQNQKGFCQSGKPPESEWQASPARAAARLHRPGRSRTGYHVQIQILGILHRCQHTAQVGAYGLEHRNGDQKLWLLCHRQRYNSQKHKSNHCHVIGNKHTCKQTVSIQSVQVVFFFKFFEFFPEILTFIPKFS